MKLKENLLMSKRGFCYLFQLDKTYALTLVLTSVLSAVIPFISICMSAIIINELLEDRRIPVLIGYVCMTVGLTFVFVLIKNIIEKIQSFHLDLLYKNEQKAFADKTMKMDYERIEDVKTTYLNEQIKIESQTGYNLYYLYTSTGAIITSLVSIISSIALTISLFLNPLISVSLKLILLASILVLSGINYFTTSKSQKIESRFFTDAVGFNAMGNYLYSHLNDYQSGKEIRLYHMENVVSNAFVNYNKRIDQFIFSSRLKMTLLSIGNNFFLHFLEFIVYAFVIYGALAGSVSIGSIVKYVSCVVLLVSSFEKLIENIQNMFQNNVYLKTYFSFFDIPSNMSNGTLMQGSKNYKLEFINVSFKYPNSDSYALRNVSFEFKIGERLAIVGMNGSGKTTFIKLLCRLYDPTEGKIMLNDIDIREYDYRHYLSLLSVVFQDFTLFSFSLAQNVAGSVDYDQTKVITCLKKTGFGDRLAEMPNDIDTYLYQDFDDKGIEISGGEAQKIAISRALYKNTPFIILDEPTASLDPIAEYEIYSKFNEIIGNKTTIFVSHRMSSCCFCDDIAVFHKGELIQRGNHDALLADESGKYYELWNAQAQYYKGKDEEVSIN